MENKYYTHCDILLGVENAPFVTLTESKLANTWYHKDIDKVFTLTAKGFKVLANGSKEYLISNNLI